MLDRIKLFLALLPWITQQKALQIARATWGFVKPKGKYAWRYILNNLVALDQQANALLLGDPDMTLSGRMGRAIRLGQCALCKPICKVLEILGKDHCEKQDVKEADEGKDQLTRT